MNILLAEREPNESFECMDSIYQKDFPKNCDKKLRRAEHKFGCSFDYNAKKLVKRSNPQAGLNKSLESSKERLLGLSARNKTLFRKD